MDKEKSEDERVFIPLVISSSCCTYTLILLYKWFFYALLAIAALGFVIYIKWSDKIDEIINKLKHK